MQLAGGALSHGPLAVRVLALAVLAVFSVFALWLYFKGLQALRRLPRKKTSAAGKRLLAVLLPMYIVFLGAGYALGSPSGRLIAGLIGAFFGGIANVVASWIVAIPLARHIKRQQQAQDTPAP